MRFEVQISPSGRSFPVENDDSVLTAAFAAGVKLPNGCRMGTCRTCRGKVIEGSVDHGHSHPEYLTPEMRDQGYALLCQAKPCSDLLVEIEELPFLADPQVLPAYVKGLDRLAPDVVKVHLRLPLHANMPFVAGQYIDIIMADGRRRAYSIANAPTATGVVNIELHIRHFPGGAFTDHVFDGLKLREMLQIEGPLGSFFLRDGDNPVLLLATGTGYAPIRSIILDALEWQPDRQLTLYWGARTRADLYMLEEVEALARDHPSLTVIPVLSRPLPEDNWTGRIGHVQDCALADIADVSKHHVYACGAPAMTAAADRDFAARGLPDGAFFSDAFFTEAELA